MRDVRTDAQLETLASQHTVELAHALQELGSNDEHAYKIHNEVYKTVCKVLKPGEGQERPSGAGLEEIRRSIAEKLDAIEQMQGRSAQLGRKVYQVVESQIKQIDHAVAHEEESMAEVRERILALTPEGMTPEALLRTDAGGGGGGASAAGSRAGRRSKAKATSVAAAPAPLATSELLAPIAQAVPQHHVPYKFHLPGREPFVEFIDPGEPMYCKCQQPSQGSMIGCDNPSCKYEWYHYACVGITEEPEHWVCPDCAAAGYRL